MYIFYEYFQNDLYSQQMKTNDRVALVDSANLAPNFRTCDPGSERSARAYETATRRGVVHAHAPHVAVS